MIYATFAPDGGRRLAQLDGIFQGCTAFLIGGAQTILEQPLHLLESRGVLSAAINNAAMHFKPTLWFSGDYPLCYDPQILHDPSIMKFSSFSYNTQTISGRNYKFFPNTYFYIPKLDIPIDQMLDRHRYTPFYKNTMLTAIHILYQLGVRRIIIGGSDFEFDDQVYAHETNLSDQEKDLNRKLYTSLVDELISLKPVFVTHGLELMDCSVKSKLADTYKHVSMQEAYQLATESFPEFPARAKDLPHGTKFASPKLKKQLGILPENYDPDDELREFV